jgi:polyisoprenyl-teichoic acid--peptidoglycan teichoic acid transferase
VLTVRPRRSWRQRLVIAGGALSVFVFAAGAFAISYLYRKVEQLPRVELSQVLEPATDVSDPRNVLIVGVDSAEQLEPGDPVRFGRDGGVILADVIMILRVDPEAHRADLLSIPRDLWVQYPDSSDQARINTALDRDGGSPDLLIDTLDDYLGIPVHHYIQLDFAGFRQLVEAVGGVPLYFEQPTRDQRSGLHVPEPGCVTLDAEQALAYARSRAYQENIDGEWRRDPTGDLGRIERQQVFIRATVGRALSRGARNPGALDQMLDAALASVTVDGELSTGEIVALARRFRSFDPEDLRTYRLPVTPDRVGAAEIVRLDDDDAEPILELFQRGADGTAGIEDVDDAGEPDEAGDPEGADADEPSAEEEDGEPDAAGDASTPEPGEIDLRVLNGSGQPGHAGQAAADLEEAGFGVTGQGNAGSFNHDRTEVRYPPGARAAAEVIERWLVAGADLVESASEEGIAVVTGADWDGARMSPRPASDGSGGTPTTTTTTPTTTAHLATPC